MMSSPRARSARRAARFLLPLQLLASAATAQQIARAPLGLEIVPAQLPDGDAAGRPTFANGELLVRYRQGALPGHIDARGVEAALGMTRVSFNAHIGLHRYRLPAGVTVREALNTLRDDPRIEYVEPNYIHYLHAVPNDTFYGNYNGEATDLQKWAMDGIGSDRNVNAEAAWDVTTGRSDVVIAVVDTGLLLNHPDIAPNLWSNPGETPGNGIDDDGNGFTDDVHGYDFVDNDGDPTPDFGDGVDNDGNGAVDDNTFHGTFSASCAGAAGNDGQGVAGAAWSCSLMGVKIFSDDGGAFVSDITDGITYAAANGADVINMSFGGIFSSSVQSAVNFAWAQGAVQVASAGNRNAPGQQYPASLVHVVSVGASDSGSVFSGGSGDIDGRAAFSQYGTSAVDVVAPGTYLVGASVGTVAHGNPGQAIWTITSGTSTSSALVAGLAALVESRSRDVGAGLTNDDIEAILQNTTVNLPDDPDDFPNGGSNWDGDGRVDFYAAVDAVGGGPANNPPVADAGPNQSGLTGQSLTFDGSNSSDPDNDPIVSYVWDFGDGSPDQNGAVVNHSFGAAGIYTVTLTVSDGYLTDSDTLTATISDPPAGGPTVLLTSKGSHSIPGIGTMRNEDIFEYDPATGNFSVYFDGSDVGLGSAALDGFTVLSNGDIALSLTQPFSIPGLSGGPSGSSTDDSDIVIFTPSSLGTNTSGVFTFIFDGSDVGLTTNGEDVDAISVDAGGQLLISTVGTANANGISRSRDEDVMVFSATQLGSATAGSFSTFFDGSDVGLSSTNSEDVDALHVAAGNIVHLSTIGNFSVSGLSGFDEDIFSLTPGTLGSSTSGSFSLFIDGPGIGLPSRTDLNGIFVIE